MYAIIGPPHGGAFFALCAPLPPPSLSLQVSAVIGPHGGAFFALNYAPPGTLVLEFVPAARWRIVFWEMSTLLGMHYWAFTELPAAAPNTTEAKQNNVVVDVASVIKVGGGREEG